MHVDICSDFASAAYKLCHSKFEALVVDFKDRPMRWIYSKSYAK